MFSKHRKQIAWGLLLLAAISWAFGRQLTTVPRSESTAETMYATTYSTTYTEVSTVDSTEEGTTPGESPAGNRTGSRIAGFLLCFCAVGLGCSGIVIFRQQSPFLGPDGVAMAAGIFALIFYAFQYFLDYGNYVLWNSTLERINFFRRSIGVFLLLIVLREVWGWAAQKFSIDWFALRRLCQKQTRQLSVLCLILGWVLLAVTGFVIFGAYYPPKVWPLLAFALAALCGGICLWRYGREADQLSAQIAALSAGEATRVYPGAFAEAEGKLQTIQEVHNKAIRQAVVSERFKVELISNVSHDLRTPLTAILGYSELLQQETLSAQGQQELTCLQQKAGYMKDLVDSLFELTKVSSGDAPEKREKIDLIRLLEQTIGLYDDALNHAGLVVRRKYSADAMEVVTDGARMHQVFANLLGNAVKYALTGTRIYLEATELPDRFRVRMINTACYEMDFQPEEITRRFTRGDKARSTQGSGLGLAIAQTYTESLGGHFTVEIDGDQFRAIVELPKSERNL